MNFSRLCNKVIEFSFYAIFILVPLILTPYNYELFEFNKMLTVYFFTLVIAAAWMIRMIGSKKIIFQRTPFDLVLLLFLLSQILSTVFSIDRHTSFWGYYSRFHGGLASTLCYLTLYYSFVSNNISVKKSLKIILATALLVALYGIAERLGIDKHIWVQDVQNRVFSTLGQPNWLAAYLLTLLPLTLVQQSRLYYVFGAVFFLTILFTHSQSGILSCLLALLVFLVLFFIKRQRIKTVLLASAIFIFLLILNRQYIINGSRSLIQAFTAKDVASLINQENQTHWGGSSSMLIRRVVWQGAVAVWQHYPFFGSGVETFAYSYYNYRPPAHNLLSEWDFLYNKAHNEFLNFLATSGAFGLLSYCLIIVWFTVWVLLKRFNLLNLALLAGYLGLAVSNFFGFSVVPVALFFFLFPAFSLELNSEDHGSSSDLSNWQYLSISLILLITSYCLFQVINFWRADRFFNLGRQLISRNQLLPGFNSLKQAVKLSPAEPLFRSEYAEASAKIAYIYQQTAWEQPEQATLAGQLRDQYLEEALRQSETVLQANSIHLNYYKSRLKVLLILAEIEPQYYLQALDVLMQAIKLSPTDPKLYYNLALLYQKIDQTDLAKQTLNRALELKPNYDTAQEALAKLSQHE